MVDALSLKVTSRPDEPVLKAPDDQPVEHVEGELGTETAPRRS